MSASTSPASNRHYSYSARVEASSFFRDSPTWRPQRVIGGHLPLLAFVSYSTLFSLFFFCSSVSGLSSAHVCDHFPTSRTFSTKKCCFVCYLFFMLQQWRCFFPEPRQSDRNLCVVITQPPYVPHIFRWHNSTERERELSHLRLHK